MNGDIAAPVRDVTMFIAIPCVLATVAKISEDHMYIPPNRQEMKHFPTKPNTSRNSFNDSVFGVQLTARHETAVNVENMMLIRFRPYRCKVKRFMKFPGITYKELMFYVY